MNDDQKQRDLIEVQRSPTSKVYISGIHYVGEEPEEEYAVSLSALQSPQEDLDE